MTKFLGDEIELLPPLIVPLMNPKGYISQADLDLNNNQIGVYVYSYRSARVGDSISLYFHNTPAKVVELHDPNQVPAATFFLDAKDLKSGIYRANYTVKNLANNINTSSFIDIVIQRSPNSNFLPAPYFSESQQGRLTIDSVERYPGTPLRISWPSIELGDRVNIILSGTDKYHQSVAGANYIKTNIIINQSDIELGYLLHTLPASNVLAVGDSGMLHAYYSVDFATERPKLSSPESSVMLEREGSFPPDPNPGSDIQIVMTQNAPPTDYNSIKQYPYNMVAIYGQPGEQLQISTDRVITIKESKMSTLSLTLNKDGRGYFSMSSSKKGTFPVVFTGTSESLIHIVKSVTFNNYVNKGTTFYAVANTTGAPADKKVYCSIYLLIRGNRLLRDRITHVRASLPLDTPVEVVGYGNDKIVDIKLSSDGSTTIDLRSEHPTNVRIQLTLPESGGNVEYIPLSFIAVPETKS